MADIERSSSSTQGVDPIVGEQDYQVEKICRKFDRNSMEPRKDITELSIEIGATNFTEDEFTLYLQILSSGKRLIKFTAFRFDTGGHRVHKRVRRRDIVDGLFFLKCDREDITNVVVTFTVNIRDVETVHSLEVEMGTEISRQVEVAVPLKAPKKTMHDLFPDMSQAKMHGRNSTDEWESPICVVECSKEARPGYKTNAAHEYEDTPQTLLLKVKELARLLRASRNTLCYSGAGLSTSAGIDDYATKAGSKSRINVDRGKVNNKKVGFKSALPSIGHRTFCTLANNDLVHGWIQQNHDGLPQKAGFPQHRLNEIHGAWFDPSNPVVPMSGTLRDDLYAWMENMSEAATLCIAVGTSLSGMNADQVFENQCDANIQDPNSNLGGVIIGLQKTRHDHKSSLRIYSRIDVVMSLLMREMNLIVPPLNNPFVPDVKQEFIVEPDVFLVPYDRQGHLTEDPDEMIVWDLRDNTEIIVVDGPGEGFEGVITGKKMGHYNCVLPRMREGSKDHGKQKRCYLLGSWWAKTATEGQWRILPVVNKDAQLQKDFREMRNID